MKTLRKHLQFQITEGFSSKINLKQPKIIPQEINDNQIDSKVRILETPIGTSPHNKKLYNIDLSKEVEYTLKEDIIVNKEKQVLLYYHRLSKFTILVLSLKHIVPLTILFKLIKLNPFYLTNPALLPIMTFAFIFNFLSMTGFFRKTKFIVNEIWLDPSGLEIKIVYRRRIIDYIRQNYPIKVIYNRYLVSKEQDQSLFRKGDQFPVDLTFNHRQVFSGKFFWIKYYSPSQYYFLLPKRAIYCNYEALIPAFQGCSLDYKSVESVSQINFEEKNKILLHKTLHQLNKIKK